MCGGSFCLVGAHDFHRLRPPARHLLSALVPGPGARGDRGVDKTGPWGCCLSRIAAGDIVLAALLPVRVAVWRFVLVWRWPLATARFPRPRRGLGRMV